MVSSILKNAIMLALLIIIILLIFGIFFYNNIPSNKIVPDKVVLALPEQLQQELDTTLEDEQKEVLVTYVVKENDLNVYQRNKAYTPGKVDPFVEAGSSDSYPGSGGNSTTGGGATGGGTSGK